MNLTSKMILRLSPGVSGAIITVCNWGVCLVSSYFIVKSPVPRSTRSKCAQLNELWQHSMPPWSQEMGHHYNQHPSLLLPATNMVSSKFNLFYFFFNCLSGFGIIGFVLYVSVFTQQNVCKVYLWCAGSIINSVIRMAQPIVGASTPLSWSWVL